MGKASHRRRVLRLSDSVPHHLTKIAFLAFNCLWHFDSSSETVRDQVSRDREDLNNFKKRLNGRRGDPFDHAMICDHRRSLILDHAAISGKAGA